MVVILTNATDTAVRGQRQEINLTLNVMNRYDILGQFGETQEIPVLMCFFLHYGPPYLLVLSGNLDPVFVACNSSSMFEPNAFMH